MSESEKKPSIGHNGGPPVSAEAVHLRQAQRGVYADDRLSSSEKLLATYMMNRADKSYDNAYPRVDVIAEDTSLDRKTVISGLRSLVEKGWFSTRQYPGHSQRKIYSVRDVDFLASMVSRFQDRDRERANISYRNERQGKRTYSKYGTENGTGETGPKNGTGSKNGILTGTKNGTQTGGTIPPRSAPSSAPSSASEAGTPPNNLRDLNSPKLKTPTPTPPPGGVACASETHQSSEDLGNGFFANGEAFYGPGDFRIPYTMVQLQGGTIGISEDVAMRRAKTWICSLAIDYGMKGKAALPRYPGRALTQQLTYERNDSAIQAARVEKASQSFGAFGQQEAQRRTKSPFGRYTKATLGEKL